MPADEAALTAPSRSGRRLVGRTLDPLSSEAAEFSPLALAHLSASSGGQPVKVVGVSAVGNSSEGVSPAALGGQKPSSAKKREEKTTSGMSGTSGTTGTSGASRTTGSSGTSTSPAALTDAASPNASAASAASAASGQTKNNALTGKNPLTGPALGVAAYRKIQSAAGPVGELGLEREMALLREQVAEQMGELKTLFLDLAHRQSLMEKWRERSDVVALYRRLLSTGLSSQLAREFAEKAAEGESAWGGDLTDHLLKVVKPRLRCLSAETAPPHLLTLTGPSGAGKTTSLARLAAFHQKRGLKVSAITLDTLKLGAAEQLTQYARIMGFGLMACQTKAEFVEACELFRGDDLVLVDTNTRDFTAKAAVDELSAALLEEGAKNILVLPAGLKTEDLEDLHRKLGGPTLFGLILTKIDETGALGNVVSFLAANGPPLAFFSSGPRTPEDFQVAKPEKLLERWLAPTGPPGS